MKNVIIKVATGKKIGLGHLSSMVHLTKKIKKSHRNKYNFKFIVNNNKDGILFLKQNNINFIIDTKFRMNSKLIIKYYDYVIYDFPINKFIISKNISSPTYFYTNSYKKIISNADYIVAHHNLQKKYKYNRKIYRGLKFKIFDSDNYKYNFSKLCKACLICIGGTDKRNLNKKIFNIIKNFKFNDIKFYFYLRSQNIKKKDYLFYRNSKENNIKFIYDLKSITPELKKFDLGIVSGGNILLQLCKSNIPSISVPQDKNELLGIRELEKIHCTAIGQLKFNTFNSDYFANILLKYVNNINNRKKIHLSCKKTFDINFVESDILSLK